MTDSASAKPGTSPEFIHGIIDVYTWRKHPDRVLNMIKGDIYKLLEDRYTGTFTIHLAKAQGTL